MKVNKIGECAWKKEALEMINRYTNNTEIELLEERVLCIRVITVDGREIRVNLAERSGFSRRNLTEYLYMNEKIEGKWKRIKK